MEKGAQQIEPLEPEKGFIVEVRCHTKEAFDAITSPEALRFQIGHMIDSWGLQEEIDYTLKVERLRR